MQRRRQLQRQRQRQRQRSMRYTDRTTDATHDSALIVSMSTGTGVAKDRAGGGGASDIPATRPMLPHSDACYNATEGRHRNRYRNLITEMEMEINMTSDGGRRVAVFSGSTGARDRSCRSMQRLQLLLLAEPAVAALCRVDRVTAVCCSLRRTQLGLDCEAAPGRGRSCGSDGPRSHQKGSGDSRQVSGLE